MEIFWQIIKTLFPIFSFIILGYLLKLGGILQSTTARQINKMIFWVTLPLFIFYSVYQNGIVPFRYSSLEIFILIAIGIEFFLGLFLVLFAEHENKKKGVLLQAFVHGDFLSLGLPILTAFTSVLVPDMNKIFIFTVTLLFYLLSILALALFRGAHPNFLQVVKEIFTNPLILAMIAGFIFLHFKLAVPTYLIDSIKTAGNLSVPLICIMLGVCFNFSDAASYFKQIALTILFKNLIFPALVTFAAVLLGYKGGSLAAIFVITSAPAAVHTFTISQELEGDENLSAQLVVFTSLFFIASVFLFVFILKQTSML